MPKLTFKITGEIGAFDRIDNFFKSLKREGDKLLTDWTIELDASYIEKKGEKPV